MTGVLITFALVPGMLPPERPSPATTPPRQTDSTPSPPPSPPKAPAPKRRTPSQVWALGVLALLLMLCEGVANDWSVLHLKDVLDAPAATAALAYGGFATAMTVGRFVTDRVVGRFGRVFVVRYGAAFGALGLTVASLSPWVPLALFGWTVFGIGLSGCIPQFFTAAGNVDPESSGANVSKVAGLGYVGMLAGPAIIGPLTHLVPLNLTFFLPVAFCVAAAVSAGILRPAHRKTTRPEPARPKHDPLPNPPSSPTPNPRSPRRLLTRTTHSPPRPGHHHPRTPAIPHTRPSRRGNHLQPSHLHSRTAHPPGPHPPRLPRHRLLTARTRTVNTPAAAFARITPELTWRGADNRPVRDVFVLTAPYKLKDTGSIQAYSILARHTAHPGFRHLLAGARTADELYALFSLIR